MHQRIHLGEKAFKYSLCPKSFSQKIKLNEHRLIHSEEKIFKYKFYHENISQRSDLTAHFGVHPNVFIQRRCPISAQSAPSCSHTVVYQPSLNPFIHLEKKPDKETECTVRNTEKPFHTMVGLQYISLFIVSRSRAEGRIAFFLHRMQGLLEYG